MRSNILRVAVLAVGPAVALPPASGSAQTLDLSSSVVAACIGADCRTVRFRIDFEGISHVDFLRIFSTNAGLWTFADVVSVQGASGPLSGWTATKDRSGTWLRLAGLTGTEPLFVTVNMGNWSTASNLSDGAIAYRGEGNTGAGRTGKDVAFDGTVVTRGLATPEPATLLLLGTGLAGALAVGRRMRRRRPEV